VFSEKSGHERKYQFKRPGDTKEHVEALYEELASGAEKDSAVMQKTLKAYVLEIVEHLRGAKNKTRDGVEEKEVEFWRALVLLGVAALALIVLGNQEAGGWAWLDKKRFSFKLTGTLLAFIFLMIQIERMAFFKVLWGYGFTKLIVSIGASALLVFSTGKAAGVINGVFGVDSTALPLSLTFMTGFIFFKYLSPFVFLIGLLALVHVLIIAVWLKAFAKGDIPTGPLVSSAVFFIFSILVMGFYWGWGGTRLSDERLPEVAYKLANILDFNNRHLCANIPSADAVVFIGSSQNVVLIDPHPVSIDSVQAFFEQDLTIPPAFERQACALPSAPSALL
jgi:hypothetical protein